MSKHRGFTLPEVIVAATILLVIMTLAVAEFSMTFAHHTLTSENLSNEQQARVAMAKIANSLSQASQNISVTGTPAPAVINPPTLNLPTSALTFYRVATLQPAGIGVDAYQAPAPAYKVHIISYDAPAQTVNEYDMNAAAYGGPSPAPAALAKHVTRFEIIPLASAEYQINIEVNNIERQNLAERPFALTDNVKLTQ
jgi:prepilin-type N-terminal cleavage/methylation domain-containing protein